MNKLTKAAIAGGAGIILLMGGAGTFAVWNDSAVAGNATITAGTLEIKASTTVDAVWTDQDGEEIPDILAYRIVPGDVITYTATFDLTAVGENLTADLALSPGAITQASSDAEDVALFTALSKSVAFTINDVPGTTLAVGTGNQSVKVTASITWPDDNTDAVDNAARTGSVNLAKFGVTLTQTI